MLPVPESGRRMRGERSELLSRIETARPDCGMPVQCVTFSASVPSHSVMSLAPVGPLALFHATA